MKTLDRSSLLAAVEEVCVASIGRRIFKPADDVIERELRRAGWDDSRKDQLVVTVAQIPEALDWVAELVPHQRGVRGGSPRIWVRTDDAIWSVWFSNWKWSVSSTPLADCSALTAVAVPGVGGVTAVHWRVAVRGSSFWFPATDPDFGSRAREFFLESFKHTSIPEGEIRGALASVAAAEAL